jgi:hypothetical protein
VTKILQLVLTDTSANAIMVRVDEDTANDLYAEFYNDNVPNFFAIEGVDGEKIVIDTGYVAGIVVRNDDGS